MKELFKTPFGSRLYGTFTESSDYDWKVIHLPQLRDLLIPNYAFRNKFHGTSSNEFKNTSDDTDTEYIALQTLARDFVAGQAYAIEVASAIINAKNIEGTQFDPDDQLWSFDTEVYMMVSHGYMIQKFVKEMFEKYLTSQMNGMVGYAYHQAKLYSVKGDRLNFLQDTLQAFNDTINRGNGEATIHELAMGKDNFFLADMFILSDRKKEWMEFAPMQVDETDRKFWSLKLFKKKYLGTSKVAHVAVLIEKSIGEYGKRAQTAADNDGHDWKALSHAVRVTFQAIELLETGKLTLPFKPEQIQSLKNIKAGIVPFEHVQALIEANVDLIDSLKLTTSLQPYTETLQKEFDEWLKDWMEVFYNIDYDSGYFNP